MVKQKKRNLIYRYDGWHEISNIQLGDCPDKTLFAVRVFVVKMWGAGVKLSDGIEGVCQQGLDGPVGNQAEQS